MPNTYTTQDGKTAVPVNPYQEYITADIGNGSKSTTNDLAHIDFQRNNPPIPLTTERPDLIGKEFTGHMVLQKFSNEKWISWEPNDTARSLKANFIKTRQALSVPVKVEEQPKLSVEDAAEKGWYERFQSGNNNPSYDEGFIDGHTHATKDANLVPLDKVESVISKYFDSVSSIEDVSEVDLITQIKNLTKE